MCSTNRNFNPTVKQIKALLSSGKFKKILYFRETCIINNRTFYFVIYFKDENNIKKYSNSTSNIIPKCKHNSLKKIYFIYTYTHCLLALRHPCLFCGKTLWLYDSLGSSNNDIKIIKNDLEFKLKIKVSLNKTFNYQPIFTEICWGYVILFIYCYVIEKKSLVKILYELRNIDPFSVYNKVMAICTCST